VSFVTVNPGADLLLSLVTMDVNSDWLCSSSINV